jgi:hypothetical protein
VCSNALRAAVPSCWRYPGVASRSDLRSPSVCRRSLTFFWCGRSAHRDVKSSPSGAVVDGLHPQVVVNQEIMEMIHPPRGYLEAIEKRELAELERRRRLYLGAAKPVDVKGRLAIVVDDGIATGATMKAALRGVRRNEPPPCSSGACGSPDGYRRP